MFFDGTPTIAYMGTPINQKRNQVSLLAFGVSQRSQPTEGLLLLSIMGDCKLCLYMSVLVQVAAFVHSESTSSRASSRCSH